MDRHKISEGTTINHNLDRYKITVGTRLEEETEVSDNWSRLIVLKSSEGGIPLTKLSNDHLLLNVLRAVQEK